MDQINTAALLGLDDCDIDFASLEKPLHKQVVTQFQRLRESAAAAGFDLAIASSYRDFERQLLIWNEKAKGIRPVYDDNDEVIDIKGLSDWQLCQNILRFSALPGASRHHWGTDLDIYDRAAVEPSYSVQLSTQEVTDGGPFCPIHDWLDQQINNSASFGFFRPYCDDRGGIAPERWHLSYAPLAIEFQNQLSKTLLRRQIESCELLLKSSVLEHFDELFERYIWVDESLYPV